MVRIPTSFIQEVLAKSDIVVLIQSRLPLIKRGDNHTARCPFHEEKTPSFSVSQSKQFYYCFGCGAHGNAIGFLMVYDRCTFPEAIKALAQPLGMDIPSEENAEDLAPPGKLLSMSRTSRQNLSSSFKKIINGDSVFKISRINRNNRQNLWDGFCPSTEYFATAL